MTKRIYISDLHLTTQRSFAQPGAWGWTDAQDIATLATFLRSPTVRGCDEVVLVGDIFDQWLCPIDVAPPSVAEIASAAHNRPVMEALRDLRKVVYVPGNHDMRVTAADVTAAIPGARFMPDGIHEPGLRVEHGHRNCLFNGPDPTNRPYPIGYYLTRLSATGGNRNGKQPHTLQTIIDNPGKVIELLSGQGRLGEVVVGALLRTLGAEPHPVGLDEMILMPDAAPVKVGDVASMFATLYSDWNDGPGHARDAIRNELEPWYSLPWPATEVVILGHTHSKVSDPRTRYLNVGDWCGAAWKYDADGAPTRHFATTEQTPGQVAYALHRWTAGEPRVVWSDKLAVH